MWSTDDAKCAILLFNAFRVSSIYEFFRGLISFSQDIQITKKVKDQAGQTFLLFISEAVKESRRILRGRRASGSKVEKRTTPAAGTTPQRERRTTGTRKESTLSDVKKPEKEHKESSAIPEGSAHASAKPGPSILRNGGKSGISANKRERGEESGNPAGQNDESKIARRRSASKKLRNIAFW